MGENKLPQVCLLYEVVMPKVSQEPHVSLWFAIIYQYPSPPPSTDIPNTPSTQSGPLTRLVTTISTLFSAATSKCS